MKMRARSLFVAALVAGAAVVGCRNDTPAPTAPASSVSLKKVKNSKTLDTVTVVTRKSPFTSDVTVSAVIGSNGGSLELKEAGLKLIVPSGAVSSNQTFSITAMAGGLIAYEFTPHMTFAKPVQLEQQLDLFNVPNDLSEVTLGYFADRANLGSTEDEVGTIDEQLPVTFDLTGKKAKASVGHFSGYLMASGRR